MTMSGSSPTAIEMDGLAKRFRRGGTVGRLWEATARGEAVSIIGRCGAGQRIMLGEWSRVLRPNRGRIQVDDRPGGLAELTAGLRSDLSDRGSVAVNLPKLSLGEGVYQVSVAFADEKGLPVHDWHDRAYRISVVADGVTDGPVHQPRTWEAMLDRAQREDASREEAHPHSSRTPLAHTIGAEA